MVSRVNITEDGREALLKLSKGDMRRALNVLQVMTESMVVEILLTDS